MLIALIDKREQFHLWATKNAQNITPPFFTCEAVISEICFLLRNVHNGEAAILSMVEDGILQIDFSLSGEITKIKASMKKYADVLTHLLTCVLLQRKEKFRSTKRSISTMFPKKCGIFTSAVVRFCINGSKTAKTERSTLTISNIMNKQLPRCRKRLN